MLPLVLVVSYLIGSIPFSHIFPGIKGKDVRSAGTRNVGATNALIVAGPLMGALALVGDVAKGLAAVLLANYLLPGSYWAPVLAGLAAVVGHDFSIFLKFKGGKGVATTMGALLVFDPVFSVIVILLWALLILITRYLILSTLIIFLALPVMLFLVGKSFQLVVFALAALLLALYTHRADIKRLISGKELTTAEAVRHYMGDNGA